MPTTDFIHIKETQHEGNEGVITNNLVKLINHDCLPILMLLSIMLYVVLAYLMLYIVLACPMPFVALSSAVCLHNASFSTMISANAFYLHALSWFIDT